MTVPELSTLKITGGDVPPLRLSREGRQKHLPSTQVDEVLWSPCVEADLFGTTPDADAMR